MRRFLRKLRQLMIRTILLLAGVAVFASAFDEKQFQLIYGALWWIGTSIFIGILVYFAKSINKTTKTYVDAQGYVRIYGTNEYEHRHIAKNVLKRDFLRNEVVHHINGKRSDNRIKNLCVMDKDQHELFHAWLDWKKKKTRRYPHFSEQKRFLCEVHRGILLESHTAIKPASEITRPPQISTPKKTTYLSRKRSAEESDDGSEDFSQNLFTELRKERNRLAKEQDIPAYLVFKNFTLTEMARRKPQDAKSMKSIIGVTTEKFRLYGEQFLGVIRKHSSNIEAAKDRNSAS